MNYMVLQEIRTLGELLASLYSMLAILACAKFPFTVNFMHTYIVHAFKVPQNSVKICGPFCGPSCVHSGPLEPLRASDKNPETRTIKQNQLTSLNENGCPGDSRRLHHFYFYV